MSSRSGQEERRPNPIERALAGWQPAQVLMCANRLDVFTRLGDEALPVEELSARCSAHPRSTRMLLNACVALGFLQKEGPLYRNSPEARDMLVRGGPAFIGDGIAHQADLWQAWGRLHEAVRHNRRVRERPGAVDEPAVHRNFILAMHNRAMRAAPALTAALDLSGRRQLFDAGGGPGTYSIFLAKRYTGLRAIVFDLPQTVEITREIIGQFGVAHLVGTQAGDYFEDDFGRGNDVVLLSAIIHSMSPARAGGLFRKAHDSLLPGGLLVVQEGLLDDEGTSPLGPVLFALNMLVNTGEGQSYSAAEIAALMQEAGFVQPRLAPLPAELHTSLMIGVKP